MVKIGESDNRDRESMVQPRTPAALWTDREGRTVKTIPVLNGGSVFLLAGGPSVAKLDIGTLDRPGCLSISLNNAPKTLRTNWWISVDEPRYFLSSIWLDPKIQKFVRDEHRNGRIFDGESGVLTETTAEQCPNVLFFRSDLNYSREDFLVRDSVSWGMTTSPGGRSVLLAALKVLFHLGAGDVHLLGVDFHMSPDYAYHFPQERTEESVKGNLATYRILKEVFEELRPEFEKHGFRVWNCNPDSCLEAFPYRSLKDAVAAAVTPLPDSLETECTEGLYGPSGTGNDSAAVFESNTPPNRSSQLKRIDRSKVPAVVNTGGLNEGAEGKTTGIVLLADKNFEWMLPWWFHHFRVSHPTMEVVVFDCGLGEMGRKWLEAEQIQIARISDGLPGFRSAWFYKPFALADSPFEHSIFCDLDCEIRGNLSAVFGWAGAGTVVGRDLFPVGRYRKMFRERYYYNSGLIGVSKKSDTLDAWCRGTIENHETFRSDQEILNLVLYETEAPVVELPEGFHQLRLAGESSDATVMHWTGEPGKRHIRLQMDKLGIATLK